jgi:protein KRI1
MLSYILNRGWIDRSFHRVPTHKDIIGESMNEPQKSSQKDDATEGKPDHIVENPDDLSGDDEFEEVNELFETSYNFRFEEPYALLCLLQLQFSH